MAQDDFSFDPRSWSKGGPQGDGADGAPAAKADLPEQGRKARKPKKPAKPDATAPQPATPARESLPEAWSAVVDAVSAGTVPPTAKTREPTSAPARSATTPPREPSSAKPATTPPAGGTATGKTALPEAWSAVVTGMSPTLPTAAPADVGEAEGPVAKPNRRLPLMLALSAVLLAGGAWAAWTTRQAGPAEAAGPRPVTARQVVASEAPPPPTAVERAINIGSVAELGAALVALGVSQAEADAGAKAVASALKSSAGSLRAHVLLLPQGEAYRLERLQASHIDGSGVVVLRGEDGTFTPRAVAADLTREIKVLHGELDSESFYTSAVAAGLIDTLIPEFINAFAFDFNLASEVQPGDTFEVAFEQSVNDNGEAVGQPQLLYASLTTKVKSVALYRFKLPDGSVGWFDGNGASTKRGFMRTPVDGARISSKFGLRFHPVLHYSRLHAGVDFAVPIGTPVYAAAAGTVIGSSPTGCGGNMAVIQHENGWITRYFHLSRFAPGLQNGQQIEQGFTVGLSGNTGSCTTGPHLHYEVRVKGEPVDPLSIKTDDGKRVTMDAAQLGTFIKERDRVDVARAKQAF